MSKHQALVDRGRQIVMAAPQAYIDLDVEADGPAGYGSLLSVGAVSPWGEMFYIELRPSRNTFVPRCRDFCEAHNLPRERLLKVGVAPDRAMRALAKWSNNVAASHGKECVVLTAFNASYDFPHVDLAMLENGVESPFGIAGFCVKSLALALYPGYDWDDTSKSKLPREIIPPGNFTHNALDDAIYQQQLHFALVAKLAEMRK